MTHITELMEKLRELESMEAGLAKKLEIASDPEKVL